jgi:SAM-dependent methyltransferase
MKFDVDYFENRKYSSREVLIKLHALEALKWVSTQLDISFLDGKGKKVLDVGCAYGYVTSLLKKLMYETYGLDVSAYALKLAVENKPKDAEFIVSDIQRSLPFMENTFDLVICFDVLEHLLCPEKALKNMYAVCKDVLLCTTPHRVMDRIVKKLIRDYDETHINTKTPGEWMRIIKKELSPPPEILKIECYYDIPLQVSNKVLFYKSLRFPKMGLGIRILIKKRVKNF